MNARLRRRLSGIAALTTVGAAGFLLVFTFGLPVLLSALSPGADPMTGLNWSTLFLPALRVVGALGAVAWVLLGLGAAVRVTADDVFAKRRGRSGGGASGRRDRHDGAH